MKGFTLIGDLRKVRNTGAAPRKHTVVKRTNSNRCVEYFCTACGRYLDHDEGNKRCSGGHHSRAGVR